MSSSATSTPNKRPRPDSMCTTPSSAASTSVAGCPQYVSPLSSPLAPNATALDVTAEIVRHASIPHVRRSTGISMDVDGQAEPFSLVAAPVSLFSPQRQSTRSLAPLVPPTHAAGEIVISGQPPRRESPSLSVPWVLTATDSRGSRCLPPSKTPRPQAAVV